MTEDPDKTSKDSTAPKRSRPNRRIILPSQGSQEVITLPTLESLTADALAIIGNELTRYRCKTSKGITLDLKEARVITGYLDALTRASKESREQARSEDLSDLSNEELLQLATQIAGTNKRLSGLKQISSVEAPGEAVEDNDE